VGPFVKCQCLPFLFKWSNNFQVFKKIAHFRGVLKIQIWPIPTKWPIVLVLSLKIFFHYGTTNEAQSMEYFRAFNFLGRNVALYFQVFQKIAHLRGVLKRQIIKMWNIYLLLMRIPGAMHEFHAGEAEAEYMTTLAIILQPPAHGHGRLPQPKAPKQIDSKSSSTFSCWLLTLHITYFSFLLLRVVKIAWRRQSLSQEAIFNQSSLIVKS
jgi:hypothetical protein